MSSVLTHERNGCNETSQMEHASLITVNMPLLLLMLITRPTHESFLCRFFFPFFHVPINGRINVKRERIELSGVMACEEAERESLQCKKPPFLDRFDAHAISQNGPMLQQRAFKRITTADSPSL